MVGKKGNDDDKLHTTEYIISIIIDVRMCVYTLFVNVPQKLYLAFRVLSFRFVSCTIYIIYGCVHRKTSQYLTSIDWTGVWGMKKHPMTIIYHPCGPITFAFPQKSKLFPNNFSRHVRLAVLNSADKISIT